jgi:hypothetical protein
VTTVLPQGNSRITEVPYTKFHLNTSRSMIITTCMCQSRSEMFGPYSNIHWPIDLTDNWEPNVAYHPCSVFGELRLKSLLGGQPVRTRSSRKLPGQWLQLERYRRLSNSLFTEHPPFALHSLSNLKTNSRGLSRRVNYKYTDRATTACR